MEAKSQLDISLLKDLDIRKVEADQDQYLQEYFIEIDAYKQLENTSKYIVSGRKWTWKTALKKIFYKRNKDKFNFVVFDLKFNDIYNTSFFDDLMCSYEDHKKTFVDQIKFVLMVRLMQIIIDDVDIKSDQKKYLTKFIEINWFGIWSLSKIFIDIKNKVNFKINQEISLWLWVSLWNIKLANGSSTEYEISSINLIMVLPDLQKLLIWMLIPEKNYIILIDKLDELWLTYYSIYDNIIIGFVNAIRDINYSLREFHQIYSKNTLSRLILFIRDDMLDRIKRLDWNINKIVQDDVIKIDWQTDYLWHKSLLSEMVNKRIKKGLEILGDENNYENTNLMVEILNNNSIINSIKWYLEKDTTSLSEIQLLTKILFNRTYLKPRDLIKYFHFLSKNTDHIIFEKEYSDYLLNEIFDEITPIVHDIRRTEKTLRNLCAIWSNIFNAKSFIDTYKNITSSDNREDKSPEITATKTLEKLFDYSIIWSYYQNPSYTNKTYRFKYRDWNIALFSIKNDYIIHAWLYRALWYR